MPMPMPTGPIETPSNSRARGCGWLFPAPASWRARIRRRERHGWLSSSGALKKAVNPSGDMRSIVPCRSSTAWISGVSVQRGSFVRPAGSRSSNSTIASKPRMRQARKVMTRVAEGIFRASRSRARRFSVFGDSFRFQRAFCFGPFARGGDEVDQGQLPIGDCMRFIIASPEWRSAPSALSRPVRPSTRSVIACIRSAMSSTLGWRHARTAVAP